MKIIVSPVDYNHDETAIIFYCRAKDREDYMRVYGIFDTEQFIFAYKVSHKERITIGKIFEYWNDKFRDSDGDSSLCLFLFIPGMNILFILYTFFLSLYNIFKNIEV